MGSGRSNRKIAEFGRKLRLLTHILCFILLLGIVSRGFGADTPLKYQAGPLIHDFKLTLQEGQRREILGPLFYEERSGSKSVRAFPPFYSRTEDPELEYTEIDVLYPLLTFDRFGDQSRIQLMQAISRSDAKDQDGAERRKISLFPFYFQQRSTNEALNYTAFFPFHGTLKNRMLRDEIQFTMFPVYGMSRKRDIVTRNYLYPFFHLREGNRLQGWQLWPLVGREVREAHTITNYLGLETLVPGHKRDFILSPIFLRNHHDIGTTNEVRDLAVLPFFSLKRSPAYDSSIYLWPFFKFTTNHEKNYREWGFPWPLWGIARGEGKYMNRIWPLHSHARNDEGTERDYLFWPIWRDEKARGDALEKRRRRILFFLWSDLRMRNPQTDKHMRRQDLWPLYTYRRHLDGREKLQVLSFLAPLLANNKSVERNYSPLWALWRTQKNPATQTRSDSLLWNLWRREISPEERSNSYFFGLVQSRKTADGTSWKWFHFGPRSNGKNTEAQPARSTSDIPALPSYRLDPVQLRTVSTYTP